MLVTPDPDPFTGIPAGSGILLAFSGGIDSSAAAWLCARAGFRVFPVYLRMNPADPPEGPERMRRTAEALGLSVTVLDCVDRFREEVMHLCCRIFESGRTPNPCVLCNPLFKFGFLREYALKTGCAAMATGHYVRRNRGAEGRGPVLFRGADPAKDQSYFLYGLSEEQLDFSCFPLGNMTKDSVRALVRELDLPNVQAKESQDVCFVPPGEQAGEYLHRFFHCPDRPGRFVDMTGLALGRHHGIHAFTPGQRKGTGVALGRPAYVRSLDPDRGDIVLTDDSANLMSRRFRVEQARFSPTLADSQTFRAAVQIRYRGRPAPAEVTRIAPDAALVCFDEPQRAITQGQAAVFYDGIRQLGGGLIAETEF